MNRIIAMLKGNWDLMRVLRLVIGAVLIIQAIYMRDWMPGLIGAFFFYQAVSNTGCCGSGSCSVPRRRVTKY